MFLQAILVGLGPENGNTVQVLSSSYSNPQLAQLVSAVLNGSVLLPHHLVISGVDHFYLVNERRVSDTELVHIKHLQRMLNLTVQEIQSDADNSKHVSFHCFCGLPLSHFKLCLDCGSCDFLGRCETQCTIRHNTSR